MTVDGCSGGVHTFIVEPFVPHEVEYYLCIQSHRLGDAISFSDAGVTSLPTVHPPYAIHVRPLALPACCSIFLSGNASVLATLASCLGTRLGLWPSLASGDIPREARTRMYRRYGSFLQCPLT